MLSPLNYNYHFYSTLVDISEVRIQIRVQPHPIRPLLIQLSVLSSQQEDESESHTNATCADRHAKSKAGLVIWGFSA